MNIKRCAWIPLTIILSIAINSSANAYTKKDLKNIQKYVAIAELALSIPFITKDNPTDEDFYMQALAVAPGKVLEAALEKSHPMSMATSVLRSAKLNNTGNFAHKIGIYHPLIACLLIILAYEVSMRIYLKDRIKRRNFRVIANTVIRLVLNLEHNQRDLWKLEANNPIVLSLIHSCIDAACEYAGEKILQGASKKAKD